MRYQRCQCGLWTNGSDWNVAKPTGEFEEITCIRLGCSSCRRKTMDFGDAIRALKNGNKVRRSGWNGKGMWLGLQVPDANSKMGLPYIFMSTVDGKLVPWLASQSDMLSIDWEELGDA